MQNASKLKKIIFKRIIVVTMMRLNIIRYVFRALA